MAERVQAFARRLVSQNKNRLQQDGFDLDLTYLTDEIITMGLPATGREAMYRNPIDEVVRFLETNHPRVYKVFNLCNERSYDISKFGDACASFPFEDHGAPPLALIGAFCASAKHWMLQSLDHVVAIHCKAGKGRTGLMACCLVLHLGSPARCNWESPASSSLAAPASAARPRRQGASMPSGRTRRLLEPRAAPSRLLTGPPRGRLLAQAGYQRTAADAIAFYNGRRTKDGEGGCRQE